MWGILVAIVTIGIVVVSYETFNTETNFLVHNCETSLSWSKPAPQEVLVLFLSFRLSLLLFYYFVAVVEIVAVVVCSRAEQ